MTNTKKFYKDRNIVFTQKQEGFGLDKWERIYQKNQSVIRYLIVGIEESEKGYQHYQCYIQLWKQFRMKGFKELIESDNVHLENQRGTNKEAQQYCYKGAFIDPKKNKDEYEKYIVYGPQPSATILTFGKFCKGQGQRTEMLEIKDLLDDGESHYEICNKQDKYYESYARYYAFYEKYKQWGDDIRHNEIRQPLVNSVVYGDCDTGKTTAILNKYGCKNCYILKDPKKDNKNWNGYENQKVLIIDDFYSWIPFNDMLRILDNKPYRVRKLGGYRWARWERVIITSNTSPKLWYPNMRYDEDKEEMLKAFYSRIKKCLKVSRGNTGNLLTSWIKLNKTERGSFKEYLNFDESSGINL